MKGKWFRNGPYVMLEQSLNDPQMFPNNDPYVMQKRSVNDA